jgi:UDP-glucose 4-epimerase
MILVTGGSGFIGSHTVRALADLGESCVIIQRRSGEVPVYLADLPVVSEQADVTDLDALRAVGARHKITGIVHLAGYPAPRGSVGGIEATEDLLRGFFNIVRVASEWDVRRIGLASTIGVYSGVQHVGPLTEDMPVLLTASHPIPRLKKIGELLGEQLAESTGIEIINLRISGTWGPAGHEDPFFAAPALIHAAASRSPLDLSGQLVQPHLGAEHLHYRTYNVASGRLTTNADIIDAIRTLQPGLNLELPQGATGPGNPLDITRLHDDTSYQPEYDTARAAADYIAWLRAGNSR